MAEMLIARTKPLTDEQLGAALENLGTLQEVQWFYMDWLLARYGNMTKVAKLLGVTRYTLYRWRYKRTMSPAACRR